MHEVLRFCSRAASTGSVDVVHGLGKVPGFRTSRPTWPRSRSRAERPRIDARRSSASSAGSSTPSRRAGPRGRGLAPSRGPRALLRTRGRAPPPLRAAGRRPRRVDAGAWRERIADVARGSTRSAPGRVGALQPRCAAAPDALPLRGGRARGGGAPPELRGTPSSTRARSSGSRMPTYRPRVPSIRRSRGCGGRSVGCVADHGWPASPWLPWPPNPERGTWSGCATNHARSFILSPGAGTPARVARAARGSSRLLDAPAASSPTSARQGRTCGSSSSTSATPPSRARPGPCRDSRRRRSDGAPYGGVPLRNQRWSSVREWTGGHCCRRCRPRRRNASMPWRESVTPSPSRAARSTQRRADPVAASSSTPFRRPRARAAAPPRAIGRVDGRRQPVVRVVHALRPPGRRTPRSRADERAEVSSA